MQTPNLDSQNTPAAENPQSAEHQALVTKLVAFLRANGRMTWERMEFNTLAAPMGGNWALRGPQSPLCPDVFSLARSDQSNFSNPCVYQVVISRSDFLVEMAQRAKREAYELFCEGFYIVAHVGVVAAEEIPASYGLMLVSESGDFDLVKPPVFTKQSFHHATFADAARSAGTGGSPCRCGEAVCS